MPSKRKSRVNLNRADKWRVVLTDTSPFEVPIIVSNDGFYKNLHGIAKKSAHFQDLVNALLLKDDGKSYTVPLSLSIRSSLRSRRNSRRPEARCMFQRNDIIVGSLLPLLGT
jgi:hypothetical protein